MLGLACLSVISPLACGQADDGPGAPLAGLIVHAGEDPTVADADGLEEALRGLRRVGSLDDPAAIAAITRVMLEATTIPGARVALLDVAGDADGASTLLVVASVPGSELDEEVHGAGITMTPQGQAGIVRSWPQDDRRFFAYQNDPMAPFEPEAFARGLASLQETFDDHRPTTTDGIELMLDLENLRRAWPQSLADGPARRVVAVTGLANARKVHVHVPESGPVRLAYSSRALPPDEVSVRNGPAPAAGSAVGARWPSMFDAGLRTYAVALGDEPRQAFGQQFQQWMGQHGNRLRGIVQAVEIGMDWSIEASDDGLRTEFVMPVREGIEVARLAEAMRATLVGSGFEAGGAGGTLALPEHVAAALGGSTLSIGIDSQREPAVVQIVIE